MIRINLFEDTNITTYAEVIDAFNWCRRKFGDPVDRWTYGKSEDFLGSTMCSSPGEIEYFDFKDPDDVIIFKLSR